MQPWKISIGFTAIILASGLMLAGDDFAYLKPHLRIIATDYWMPVAWYGGLAMVTLMAALYSGARALGLADMGRKVDLMEIDRCRRKYDPSRAGDGSVPGRPAAGPGDRAVLPGFPGVSGWRCDVVAVALCSGSHPRSRPAPGSSSRRCKTSPRNPTLDSTTLATPLPGPSHPSRV